jgi:hypothetical protein
MGFSFLVVISGSVRGTPNPSKIGLYIGSLALVRARAKAYASA